MFIAAVIILQFQLRSSSKLLLQQVSDLFPHGVGFILLVVRLEELVLVLVRDGERDQRCQQGVFEATLQVARVLILRHGETECNQIFMALLVVCVNFVLRGKPFRALVHRTLLESEARLGTNSRCSAVLIDRMVTRGPPVLTVLLQVLLKPIVVIALAVEADYLAESLGWCVRRTSSLFRLLVLSLLR